MRGIVAQKVGDLVFSISTRLNAIRSHSIHCHRRVFTTGTGISLPLLLSLSVPMRFAERARARRLKSARWCRADRNLSGISGTNRVRVPMREKNASMYFHYSPVYSQFILYLYLNLYIYRHNLCRNKCYIYAQRNDRSFPFFSPFHQSEPNN